MHLAYKREAVITYLKAKVLDSLLSLIYNAFLSEGSASAEDDPIIKSLLKHQLHQMYK